MIFGVPRGTPGAPLGAPGGLWRDFERAFGVSMDAFLLFFGGPNASWKRKRWDVIILNDFSEVEQHFSRNL